jgi:hypothetical protein
MPELVAALCLLLSPLGCSDSRTVLLPASMAMEAVEHCSREGPKVIGGWTPSGEDLDGLEEHLPDLRLLRSDGHGLGANGDSIADPAHYYRQYVGVVVGGKRYIYINAISEVGLDWKSGVQDICDGGTSAWGALYDPSTGEFSDLRTNGMA